MELRQTTRRHIVRLTGSTMSELLENKKDLKALHKSSEQKELANVDSLVRGNPQLTIGRVTGKEDVERYFAQKQCGRKVQK